MPLITVKVFEGELTQQQTVDIIHGITEAVIPFVGAQLREGDRRETIWSPRASGHTGRPTAGREGTRPTQEGDDMKLVSVQVGRPRRVRWHGKLVSTGIYKESVAGR